MTTVRRIGMIGGGSWATALIKILSENDVKILWWVRSQENAQSINKLRRNARYLSDVVINLDKVTVCTDVLKVISDSDIIVMAIPAAFLVETLQGMDSANFNNKFVVSAIKGIVPETNQIVCEYIRDTFKVPQLNLGVVTGPCHAEEVALEKLSYLTVACEQLKFAREFATLLKCRYVNTFVTKDIFGTEYSAVLKNVYAIASGIAHGLNYGDNFQAVLISNAIQEIKRFIDVVHPIKRDIKGSAYLGDLLVTAYSQFSRNRTFGNMLGKGYSVKSALLEMNMVAEGYYAARCIHQINKKYKVDLPICDMVYNVIYERIAPALEMQLLTGKLG